LHALHRPDIDTITYAFAGILDVRQGWGVNDDSFVVLEALESWAEHGLSWVTAIWRPHYPNPAHARRTHAFPSDPRYRKGPGRRSPYRSDVRRARETTVATARGNLSFQEYFVKRRWQEEVHAVTYTGIENAGLRRILEAIENATAIILCPSNPVTSIGPILAVPAMRQALPGKHPRR
jgi:LPPG:FO 2-phospho-L-lactate transferase